MNRNFGAQVASKTPQNSPNPPQDAPEVQQKTSEDTPKMAQKRTANMLIYDKKIHTGIEM